MLNITLVVSLMLSCEKDPEGNSSVITDPAEGVSHEESSDYSWDAGSEFTITLNGTTITTNTSNVSISGSTATITAAGNYKVSGTLSDGQIIVNASGTDLVRLILNGTEITNSTGSALLIENSQKTIIHLAEGTQNEITDGSSYANPDDDPNAAIFSKSDLTIFGTGTLTVNGKYKDGITGKDGLIIRSGTIAVTAADDGIRGKDFLIVKGGTITVNSGGDGMKSDNENNTSAGYILIEAGTFKITAGGDGIAAQTTVATTGGNFDLKTGGGSTSYVSGDASAKAIKGLVSVTLDVASCAINSADDAIHSNGTIILNSGTYALSTGDDGIHADAAITVNGGDIGITKSVEGIESHFITINGGNINVVSSDDSFNATAGTRTENDDKSYIYINGGYIVLNGSNGDPLDSNGSIEMKGGTVIVHGPSSQPEVAIDYNGTFVISGGLLIASGPSSNMFQAPGTSSSQNSLKMVFKSANAASTLLHIQDADGNEIVTFSPIRKYLTMVFSSPALVKGSTYSIYKSGSSTGTHNNGFYSGGVYSPGTLVSTFTVSGTVTSLSNL